MRVSPSPPDGHASAAATPPGPVSTPAAERSDADRMQAPQRRRHSAPSGARQLYNFKGAIRDALADLLPAEQDPASPHLDRWTWFAPHLARGMLHPPHDVAHILSYLDHPAFDAQRVALGRALVKDVQEAPTDVWPRRLVVQEAILLWLQRRFPSDGAIQADLGAIYDAMGTVEARARAAAASPAYEVPWMRTSLSQLLYKAKRADHARCIETHNLFFVGGAIFAALHFAVGAAFVAANCLAWVVGVPTCFEFSLVFLACGVGIIVGWSCFYGMLWAYHRFAPWETGTRDANLDGPAFSPPPTSPLEQDLPQPSFGMPRRHSYGG